MTSQAIPEELCRDIATGAVVRWTLSAPVETTEAKGELPPRQIRGRLIETSQGLRYQLSVRRDRREVHENLTPDATLTRLREQFPAEYRHLHLTGTGCECELRISPSGKLTMRRRQASPRVHALDHDRAKAYPLESGTPIPFLVEAGLMAADGRVKASGQAKYRQINRYLEFLRDVLPHLPDDRPLEIVDFGCGKSSLTFALQHWLEHIVKRPARLVGLDRDPHVIEHCRRVTEKLGLLGLSFAQGDIAGYSAGKPIDLVISLHACDTATDDALIQAVRWRASVILAVPCCQHEAFEQIESSDLQPLLKHGIVKERVAAQATDALRALGLEANGYQTRIVEFIDMEHTPKNLLIRAVRTENSARSIAAREEYARLKDFLGLRSLRTDGLLELSASE